MHGTEQILKDANTLMKRFAKRTGLGPENGQTSQRYLWTDAFALFNFLALKRSDESNENQDSALKLIHEVHHHLGKFAKNDPRTGWISELPEEKAKNHPTVKGLRIGKQLPERKPDEPYNRQLEWERDGQYYHYHTRWISALVKAGEALEKEEFLRWAVELSLAGAHFIEDKKESLSMHWKMSVDLSRPLVPGMGAHDPLEGLLCALQAWDISGVYPEEFDAYINKLKSLCHYSNWQTEDALGIGGLLLNVIRATELQQTFDLQDAVKPERLLRVTEQSLKAFYRSYEPEKSAEYRLAFRECGLSLGLRCLKGNLEFLEKNGLIPDIDSKIWSIADDIEAFWLNPEHTQVSTFQDHLDINEVSLAASLLARKAPHIYTRTH
ncbi:hypothetical protein G3567_06120 [Psychroflexus sp. YR1-1]|uniref:Uncharacterized protein n=1 Tax=Psychroflexus aurantiacus TaxID=2709310 RepID=A0A6B3R493_9FLAO|nr:hypothetical protein [Psychroflexus aurantiacus]NEV93725.1 hypothetical protein [Psychroflexus aurantiacus]